MSQGHRREWGRSPWVELLAVVIFGLIWFSATQHRTLMEPDEGRYAEIPREMLASGDWIVPHLNGIEYLEKPPLQYWATAVAYKTLGVTQANSRLWSVSLGFLGLWVIYAIGRSQSGLAAGRYAALIAASCPLYVFISQINVLDMGLAFFLTCALGCFLQSRRPQAAAHWMWLCWASLALGFLQKGLVAFALPAIALSVYSLIQRDLSAWRRLQPLAGLLIVGAVASPWLLLMTRHDPDFLWFFFVHEHLLRYTTTIHARVEPWWFFIAVLLVGTLPWLNVLFSGVRRAWRNDDARGGFGVDRFLLIWGATVVVFFSLSGSKLTPYIVPAIAPLALLGGSALAGRGWIFGRGYDLILSLLLAGLCLASPLLVHTWIPEGVARAAYGNFSVWVAAAGALIVVSVGAALLLARARSTTGEADASPSALALGLCAALTLIVSGTNTLEPVRGGPSISAAIRPYLRVDRPFYCVGMYPQTVIFSLARSCILVEYHGELMTQLAGGAAHWLPTLRQFEDRWKSEPGAVAIVDPGELPRLREAGMILRTDSTTSVAIAVHDASTRFSPPVLR